MATSQAIRIQHHTIMIHTERLTLRPWSTDDAEALYRYASDPRVSRTALWPTHTSVEMSRQVIEQIFIPAPHTFAITLRGSCEPIGCIGLVPDGCGHYPALQSEREVGYWIGHPHWGNGYTTEALRAIVAYCRDTLRLQSLLLTTNRLNIASQRVATKCGFSLIASYDHQGIPSLAYRLPLQSPQ